MVAASAAADALLGNGRLPHGGGKSVIALPAGHALPPGQRHDAMLVRVAEDGTTAFRRALGCTGEGRGGAGDEAGRPGMTGA